MRLSPALPMVGPPRARSINFLVFSLILSSVVVPPDHLTIMQNKKLVQAIIWIVVISMVFALVVSVISLL